jgi:hypothetical protein
MVFITTTEINGVIVVTNLNDNGPTTKYKWIKISEITPKYLTSGCIASRLTLWKLR